MVPHPEGEWARYSDYEEARAEVDRVRRHEQETAEVAVKRFKALEAERDQARQEVLDEVREALIGENAVLAWQRGALSVVPETFERILADLATLDPSGDQERDEEATTSGWPPHVTLWRWKVEGSEIRLAGHPRFGHGDTDRYSTQRYVLDPSGEQGEEARFKPKPLITTCRELVEEWSEGELDAELGLSILRAALTDFPATDTSKEEPEQ